MHNNFFSEISGNYFCNSIKIKRLLLIKKINTTIVEKSQTCRRACFAPCKVQRKIQYKTKEEQLHLENVPDVISGKSVSLSGV